MSQSRRPSQYRFGHALDLNRSNGKEDAERERDSQQHNREGARQFKRLRRATDSSVSPRTRDAQIVADERVPETPPSQANSNAGTQNTPRRGGGGAAERAQGSYGAGRGTNARNAGRNGHTEVLDRITKMQEPLRTNAARAPLSPMHQPRSGGNTAADREARENQPPGNAGQNVERAVPLNNTERVDLQRLRKENPILKKQIANLQVMIREKDQLITRLQQQNADLMDKADVPECLTKKAVKAAGIKIKNAIFRGDAFWADVFIDEATLKKAYAANLGVHALRDTAKFNCLWDGELGKKALDGVRFKRHDFIKEFRTTLQSLIREQVRKQDFEDRFQQYETEKTEDPDAELEIPCPVGDDAIEERFQDKKVQLLKDHSWVNNSSLMDSPLFRKAAAKSLNPRKPLSLDVPTCARADLLALFLYTGELTLTDQHFQTVHVEKDRKIVINYTNSIINLVKKETPDHLELLEKRPRPRDCKILSVYRFLDQDEDEYDVEEEERDDEDLNGLGGEDATNLADRD